MLRPTNASQMTAQRVRVMVRGALTSDARPTAVLMWGLPDLTIVSLGIACRGGWKVPIETGSYRN
nr:hypothetical protein GCM10017611_22570 [Rhodococcus wratislaviensis]